MEVKLVGILLILLFGYGSCQICVNNVEIGDDSPENEDDNEDDHLSGIGILLDDAWTVDCCGLIDTWTFQVDRNAAGPVNIYMEVWRPVSGDDFMLVGRASRQVENVNTYTITGTEISVRPGDRLAIYCPGQCMVSYDENKGDDLFGNVMITRAAATVGETVTWPTATATLSGRRYGVNAMYKTNTKPALSFTPVSPVTINNNAVMGTYLTTVGCTDSDATDNVTISQSAPIDVMFTYDSSTNDITVTNTITVQTTTVTLTFQCTDGCETDTQSFIINVENVAPTILNLPNTTSISEDAVDETLIFTLETYDPTDVVTCNYNSGSFFTKLVGGKWGLYSKASPGFSYATQTSYTFSISCDDGEDSVSGSMTVYIVKNATPYITNINGTGELATISVNSPLGTSPFTVTSFDTEGDTLSYTMTKLPTDCPFAIYNYGNIELTDDLNNYPNLVACDLEITVSDSRSSGDSRTLTIDIIERNDPVTCTCPAATLWVQENSAASTVVGSVTKLDKDCCDTWSFTLTSNPTSGQTYFQIDNNGIVTTTSTKLNYEALATATFTLTADVQDGESSDSCSFSVAVQNVNEPPSLNPDDYTIVTDETNTAGSSVGVPPFVIIDEDNSDIHVYSMDCGDSSGRFQMISTTGEIKFQGKYDLDPGLLPDTVVCNVSVTDAEGLSGTGTVTISIEHINDNCPKFFPASYTFYVSANSKTGTSVGRVVATDADSGVDGDIVFTLDQSGLSANFFDIDQLGNISINSQVGYAVAYSFQVTAQDNYCSDTAVVTVYAADTTTLPPTTTTVKWKTFWDNPYNWAWFVPCILVFVSALIFACWLAMTCHGNQGCEAVCAKLRSRCCKSKKKIDLRRREVYKPQGTYRGTDLTNINNQQSVRKPPKPIHEQAWRKQVVSSGI